MSCPNCSLGVVIFGWFASFCASGTATLRMAIAPRMITMHPLGRRQDNLSNMVNLMAGVSASTNAVFATTLTPVAPPGKGWRAGTRFIAEIAVPLRVALDRLQLAAVAAFEGRRSADRRADSCRSA